MSLKELEINNKNIIKYLKTLPYKVERTGTVEKHHFTKLERFAIDNGLIYVQTNSTGVFTQQLTFCLNSWANLIMGNKGVQDKLYPLTEYYKGTSGIKLCIELIVSQCTLEELPELLTSSNEFVRKAAKKHYRSLEKVNGI